MLLDLPVDQTVVLLTQDDELKRIVDQAYKQLETSGLLGP